MAAQDNDGSSRQGWMRWWFEDRKTGRIVIGQTPNALLWIFIASWTAERLVRDQTMERALLWTASTSLALWSFDEIARGVNPWRRTLGAGVLLTQTASLIRRHA